MTEPLITIWVTSTGRKVVLDCVREMVRHCDYPNYRMLIFESKPDNEFGTVEAFKALDCDKRVWVGDYPPLGWIYNLFMANTDAFFVRLDDDCYPVCPIGDMVRDAINLISRSPISGRTISHVALEMNPRLGWDNTNRRPIPDEPGVAGGGLTHEWGPVVLLDMPGAMPLVNKHLILPWNETCHWRQAELYHIESNCQMRLLTAYVLKWWGVMGHWSAEGIDGVDRQRNLNAYTLYRDKGYFGLRPEDTWGTAYKTDNLPDRTNGGVVGG